MGKRWRRFNERVRQQLVAPHFQPASTERNQMMFREATTYFHHFKTVLKKLTRLMKDYDDMTQTVHALLECRVPRMFTVESDGSVGAELRDGDAFLGTGIQTHRLTTSSQILKTRMSEEVITTLQQWFKSYERCRVQLSELGELRLELDSRRRTVLSLGSKHTEFEGKVKEGDVSKEAPMTHTLEKLKHKERKLDLCLSEFQSKEEELNQSLRALLSEVRSLAELIGHLYQILSDAPSEAHKAFKEGTSSGVQPPIHVTRHERKRSARTEPSVDADRSNPFLSPPNTPPSTPKAQA